MFEQDNVARLPTPAVKKAVYVLWKDGMSVGQIHGALRYHIELRQVRRLVADYRRGEPRKTILRKKEATDG
jgi:hypothetical protein